VILSKDIKEDKFGAVFKARGKTTKDKADKVDKTKLPELLAEEVTRIGLPTVPTIWEPMAAVPKLDLKVINLLDNLIFAARRASEPISGFNADVISNLSTQNKDTKRSAYYTLVDQISMASSRCRSR